MFTETEISESLGGTVTELTGRRYKVRLIESDRLGSTGYYPADTLRKFGPQVFTKGTPMYLDHMTPSEKRDRPHGRVADYAAELAEDAYFVENDGLYAEVEVFEHQIPLIKSLKDKIGVSIRARGHCVDEVINGQTVPVFKDLILARSADFVVKAGAGGRIVEMLESANDTDSESASEEQEERDNMEKEVVEAIESLKTEFLGKLAEISEALKPVEKAEEKTEVDALEIAEALASSKLSVEGRKRVVALHRAGGGELSALIEAEEAYVKTATESAVEANAEEGVEVEESAKETPKSEFKLPSRWAVKEAK